jgi:hypothetical protein
MTRLPQEEIAFYYAAMMQLPPDRRQIFVNHVVQTLDAIAPRCDPGVGDIDRAVRAAFAATWTPPVDAEQRAVPRWTRNANFDRVSKMAQLSATGQVQDSAIRRS